jgi:hypothetical protein
VIEIAAMYCPFVSHQTDGVVPEFLSIQSRPGLRKLDYDPRDLLPFGGAPQIKLINDLVESLNEDGDGFRSEVSPFQHASDDWLPTPA